MPGSPRTMRKMPSADSGRLGRSTRPRTLRSPTLPRWRSRPPRLSMQAAAPRPTLLRPTMSQPDDARIQEVVLEILTETRGKPFPFFGRPLAPIRLTDALIRDAKIDGDDLTFDVLPELRERLGITVPNHAWERVYTVQDMIDVLKEHR